MTVTTRIILSLTLFVPAVASSCSLAISWEEYQAMWIHRAQIYWALSGIAWIFLIGALVAFRLRNWFIRGLSALSTVGIVFHPYWLVEPKLSSYCSINVNEYSFMILIGIILLTVICYMEGFSKRSQNARHT